ncbi:MAG: hypothetical protein CMJ83_02625 [Planctomycetes bacterium]|nr:hypothetical protein [Planctomycetota bacterium]
MQTRMSCLLLVAACFFGGAAPVLAHGWLFIPPTPPPPPGPSLGGNGAATPTPYTGPEGGGSPTYNGPVGGGSGATPSGEPAAGGGNPEPTPEPGETRPAPRTRVGNGAGKPNPRATRPTANRKAKVPRGPWKDLVRVPWTTVFPVTENGYAARADAGLRVDEAHGGWKRRAAPSILVVVDGANQKQVKALDRLNRDTRFLSAAHLFNCFRLDRRSMGKTGGGLVLSVFAADGSRIGKLEGNRLNRAFRMLERAYDKKKGCDLSKMLPKVASLVDAIAYCDHHVSAMESKIICTDCGHERHDVVQAIDQMRVRRESLERALGWLRR